MRNTIFLLLFLPIVLFAGTDGKIFIGLNATPQICLQSYRLETSKIIPSFSAGITLEYFPLKWFGVGLGTVYLDASSKFWADFKIESYLHTKQLDYIKIPIWLRFNMNLSKRTQIYIAPGVYYSFLISVSQKGYPLNRTYLNKDYGVNCIVGITYNFSDKVALDVGAKIDYGLINIEHEDGNLVRSGIDNRLIIYGLSTTIKYKLR